VFDPQRLAPGIPSATRWSPIRGYENPQTALVRTKALAAGTAGGTTDSSFWQSSAEPVSAPEGRTKRRSLVKIISQVAASCGPFLTSGINAVLNTPPLSTKPSVDILRYRPESVPVVTQLVKQPNLPHLGGRPWTDGSRFPARRGLTTNARTADLHGRTCVECMKWARTERPQVANGRLLPTAYGLMNVHGHAPPAADRGNEVSTRQVLMAALATLPRRQRAVIVLRFFHDYTEAATAPAMGTSLGTVKSQTFKALAALRVCEELREDEASDLTGSAREGMFR
jgi:hypothetical protein